MRALLEGASNPPQIEQQERAADAYLSRFGREDSAEAQKWVEENAVLPPPDAPITAAREVAVEAKLS